MGNWTFVVCGTGPHHNHTANDAEDLGAEFVRVAVAAGHHITHASIVSGGADDLLDPVPAPTVVDGGISPGDAAEAISAATTGGARQIMSPEGDAALLAWLSRPGRASVLAASGGRDLVAGLVTRIRGDVSHVWECAKRRPGGQLDRLGAEAMILLYTSDTPICTDA